MELAYEANVFQQQSIVLILLMFLEKVSQCNWAISALGTGLAPEPSSISHLTG